MPGSILERNRHFDQPPAFDIFDPGNLDIPSHLNPKPAPFDTSVRGLSHFWTVGYYCNGRLPPRR
jgi:hypothetical protein